MDKALLLGFRYENASSPSGAIEIFCITDEADSIYEAAVKLVDANSAAAPGIIYEAFDGERFSTEPLTEDPQRLEIHDLREQ
jgi:hypothetical protein